MPHATPLIGTIVAGIVLAFLFGALAHRVKLPPLVGYLVAGVVIGPFTPGYVADQHLADQLAELGVILLMFGVGLHFSLKDLMTVRAVAIPGAIVQIGVAILLGMGLAHMLGWGLAGGFVFGLALSVASTVVLLRAMQERGLIAYSRGRMVILNRAGIEKSACECYASVQEHFRAVLPDTRPQNVLEGAGSLARTALPTMQSGL